MRQDLGHLLDMDTSTMKTSCKNVPVYLIRSKKIESDQPFHLHLLEIRVAEQDITIHTKDASTSQVHQVVIFFATPGSLAEVGMLGGDSEYHIQNG
jgi:hypothetical protein